MSEPDTKERGASNPVFTRLEFVAHIKRADGELVRVNSSGQPDPKAVIGTWVPPLSWRMGQGISRALERVRSWVNRYSAGLQVLAFALKVTGVLLLVWWFLSKG